jgi:hypothetical protein
MKRQMKQEGDGAVVNEQNQPLNIEAQQHELEALPLTSLARLSDKQRHGLSSDPTDWIASSRGQLRRLASYRDSRIGASASAETGRPSEAGRLYQFAVGPGTANNGPSTSAPGSSTIGRELTFYY